LTLNAVSHVEYHALRPGWHERLQRRKQTHIGFENCRFVAIGMQRVCDGYDGFLSVNFRAGVAKPVDYSPRIAVSHNGNFHLSPSMLNCAGWSCAAISGAAVENGLFPANSSKSRYFPIRRMMPPCINSTSG